jgi:hypothetical protein
MTDHLAHAPAIAYDPAPGLPDMVGGDQAGNEMLHGISTPFIDLL